MTHKSISREDQKFINKFIERIERGVLKARGEVFRWAGSGLPMLIMEERNADEISKIYRLEEAINEQSANFKIRTHPNHGEVEIFLER